MAWYIIHPYALQFQQNAMKKDMYFGVGSFLEVMWSKALIQINDPFKSFKSFTKKIGKILQWLFKKAYELMILLWQCEAGHGLINLL